MTTLTRHHHNTGNRHAQRGDEPATAILHVRCTPSQKAAWVKAAQKAGLKLSAWAIRKLTAAETAE